MYTAEQIFNMAMDLMDKRNPTGTIDTTKTARYRVRATNILTMWQNELAKSGDLYSIYQFDNKPMKNMLGMTTGFNITEHTDIDLIYECSGPARAYYFEVDSEATVYIEDFNGAWNTLATINVPDSVTAFTSYKGIVTPSSGAAKSRIRFSGDYYYKTVNRALFEYKLQASKVPDYRPWIKKTMPDDFKSIDSIVTEYPDRQYAKDSNYKWEGRRDFYINYYFEGNYRCIYKPIPITITSLTQTLQVDEITAMSGAYYLASHLLLTEDPSTAAFFNQRFMELKLETQVKQPVSITNIVDVYSLPGGVYSGTN